MENMSGQAITIDIYELIDKVEFESAFDGICSWEITECFNGCIVEYNVNMLNFDYIEDMNILIAKDSDDYILSNMTSLSFISLNVVKEITSCNDFKLRIAYEDGYILIKGLKE